jgi:hypothetical protein
MLGNPQTIKKIEHFVKPVTKDFICEPCKKSFKSQNSYKSHLRLSKVHQHSNKIDKVDVVHQQVPINSGSEPIKTDNTPNDKIMEQISHMSSDKIIKLFNELYNEKLSDKEKLKAEKAVEKEKIKAEKQIKKLEIEKVKETKRKLKMEAYAQYTNLLKNEKVQALLKGINSIPKNAINNEKVILAPPDKKIQPKTQPSLTKEGGTTYVVVKDEAVEEVENLDDRLFKNKKKIKYKQNEINYLTGLPVKSKTKVNNLGIIEQYYE